MKNNVIVTLLFCFHSFVNAQDVSNSKDHELLTRYPGTEIKNYYERAYYETRFAISPGSYEKCPGKMLEVSGKQTSLVYEASQRAEVS